MNESVRKDVVRTLVLLYAIDGGSFLVALGWYKAPSYKAGACALLGVCVVLSSLALLWRAIKSAGAGGRRSLALGLAVNAWSLLLALGLAEAIVRSVAVRMPAGISVSGVQLLATWPELVARSGAAIAGVSPSGTWDESFLVSDRDLGWSLGRGRHDRSGRYASSQEGIRSSEPAVRYGDRKARFRVALLGDSNAFSLEVPFEATWGAQLEQMLGPDAQVLNFGVDGYGVDQMVLRYQRDVRPWHPNVVLVGFIGDDLVRSMAVYPFITFEWPGFVVKPRFALEDGKLRLLNSPLPLPEEVLSAKRMSDLPFIEHDLGYQTKDWRWRPRWTPMLARLLISRSPHWLEGGPLVSFEATADLNRELLRSLQESIERDGAAAIFVEMVDLGSRALAGDWQHRAPEGGLVAQTLAGTQIQLVDLAPCLEKVPRAERRVPSGYHFTGAGNRAVASCTAGPVANALATNSTQ